MRLLELLARKLARADLRGRDGGNVIPLPGEIRRRGSTTGEEIQL